MFSMEALGYLNDPEVVVFYSGDGCSSRQAGIHE